ncbi:hypothetical protein SBV1_180036 [Verrucomicrobia bacterium]|nr:hypothetical protein SBV1_180036 [Verrucomicrobiota bacterium]
MVGYAIIMFVTRRALKPEFKVTQPLPEWGRIREQRGARGVGVFIHAGGAEPRGDKHGGRTEVLALAEPGPRKVASLRVAA